MKIDFSRVLTGIGGEPLEGGKGSDPVVLSTIAVNALLASYADEQNLPGTDKVKRYELARKLHKGGEVDVAAEDVTLVKQLVGKAYAPLIVGQVWSMLEGN